MKFPRRSGILLHPTSLPSPGGIGDLGKEAYRFVDFLAASGQRLWQVLPLSPLGFENSPYSSSAVLAGNPLLISLEELVGDGILSPSDLAAIPEFPPGRVDYGLAAASKMKMLARARRNFLSAAGEREKGEMEEFSRSRAAWLDDSALFQALKERYGGRPWHQWPEEIAFREPAALRTAERELAAEIALSRFRQYLFSRQWHRLREYANDRGVAIIGDLSFFANHDSVDVWTRRDFFLLDDRGRRLELSGVPPSRVGVSQIWDMPLYNWEAMEEAGFPWWRLRFSEMLAAFDIVRVDHFSGFYACWHIRPGASTSAEGRWVRGPGTALFRALAKERGPLPIIGEALEPKIKKKAERLLRKLGYPGIRILQHGFSGHPDNPHLPGNYPSSCAAYSGTHDDDTALGWFAARGPAEQALVLGYLGGADGENLNWRFIKAVQNSAAETAIIPLQDVLGLGSEARMNIPGAGSGQWEWRYRRRMLTEKITDQLFRVTRDSGR
jgi:4-alpha-glucanotransferase